jgi:hypothetical protein
MRFEEWLLETENTGTRLERFLSEWDNGMSESDIMVWMKAAYEMGLEHAASQMSDKGYEVATLQQADAFAEKRNYQYCNGFCGEYECKENQANCKRLQK